MHNFTDNLTDSTTDSPIGTATDRPKTGGTGYSTGYYGETTETLWKVIPPIIMAWGLTGNVLTVMVLLRQMMRKVTSTSMYLMTLALSDSAILLCGPLRNFVKFVWKEDVRNFTDAGCRMQLYFTYACIQLSSWLLVAVTVERVLSVTLPFKVRSGCTPRMAGILIFVTIVCVYGLNVCIAVTHGLVPLKKNFRCGPTSKEYKKIRDDIWQWVDFCVAFAVPFIFLLVGNIVIIVHLYKSMQRKKKMTASDVSSSKTKSISILLILLCFVFFTTMCPVSIFNVYQTYRYEEILKMSNYKDALCAFEYLIFQHAVVNLVGYTNASFNFVMYVLSGSKFRNELKQMICSRFKTDEAMDTPNSKTKKNTGGKLSPIPGNSPKTMNNSTVRNGEGHKSNPVTYIVDEATENDNVHTEDFKRDNCIDKGVENAVCVCISEEKRESINDYKRA